MTHDWRVEVAAQQYASLKTQQVNPKDECDRAVLAATSSNPAREALVLVLSEAFLAGYGHGFATAMELPR